MPRRNEQQRIKRNETRRNLKKLSRKAIFCMDHLRIIHPDIHKEATELYEYINSIYPHKHNLTKTALYQRSIQSRHVKEQVIKQSREVNPRLEIPLMSLTTRGQSKEPSQQQQQQQQQQRQTTATDEEIAEIIRDLQQEPDLKRFFNQIEVGGSEPRPKTLEEEIDAIIQAEFQALDVEFQDLTNVDELLC